jgi:O-antigen ligase
LPAIGKDHSSKDANNIGSWQGVFAQKNTLGAACALAVAVALGLKPRTHVDRAWRWGLLGAALLCSYKSQSRESWIAIILLFLLLGFFKFIGWFTQESRLPIATMSAVIFFGLAGLLYYNLDAALALIGRTRTLTGRTEIWDATMLLVMRRPWFGYGTYGVWGTNTAYDAQVRVGGWHVTSSHNDYLEIILSYGIIGFLIYIPIILSAFLYMIRAVLSYDLPEHEVLIYSMIAILVVSFAAPIIMFNPALGMVVILYCASHLERVERSGFMRLPD